MPKYAEPARQTRKESEAEEVAEVSDLRDEQLSDDVACCLNAIDAAIEESEDQLEAFAENLKAQRELASRDYYANFSPLTIEAWQEKYSKLGADFVVSCCGTYIMFDGDAG